MVHVRSNLRDMCGYLRVWVAGVGEDWRVSDPGGSVLTAPDVRAVRMRRAEGPLFGPIIPG